MNDVLSVVRGLTLSEATVDTPQALDSLRHLKDVTQAVDDDGAGLAEWLSDEHYAAGVLLTAATMNKRAAVSGIGNPFNRQSRATIISRFNAWAAQFADRIRAYQLGKADVPLYLARLSRFKEDPINNQP